MKKVYKGWELLKEISEGNIKEGTKVKIIQKYGNYTYAKLYKSGSLFNLMNEEFDNPLVANWLIDTDFEIIEDQEEINIQELSEIPKRNIEACIDYNYQAMAEKYNDLVQAVKALDKKIKENSEVIEKEGK